MRTTYAYIEFIQCLYRDLLNKPELAFSRALKLLQNSVDAACGLAQIRDLYTGRMIVSVINDYPASAYQAYQDHFASRDPWQALFMRKQVSCGVNRSDEIIDRRSFECSEFYYDYWRQLDYDDAIGIFGRVGDQFAFTFGLPRHRHDGDFNDAHKRLLQPFEPHLHNAIALMLDVRRQKLSSGVHSPLLERLPLAIFLVDRCMRVIEQNQAASKLLQSNSLVTEQQGLLSFQNARLQAQLTDKITAYSKSTQVSANAHPEAVRSMSACNDRPSHNIYLLPVFDGYQLCFQLVITSTDVDASQEQMTMMLMQLFDLTVAEAEVAAGLFFGHTLAVIARQRAVSNGTARAQLKSVMAKVGCHSQIELVRRISQLVIPFC